jgi:16S rRNA processing protein RimM
MGRLAGAFGVRGWLKVAPYTQDPDTLTRQRRWLIESPRGWREHEVRESKMHGGGVIALIDGIGTREEAAALRGAQVGVPREVLAPLAEGEAYWSDLVGLAVVNRQGEALGTVIRLLDNGTQGLLCVGGGAEKERLIPYVPAIVESVDFEAGRIVVGWEADW